MPRYPALAVLGLVCAAPAIPAQPAVAPSGPRSHVASIPAERLDSVHAFVARARRILGLPGVSVSVATAEGVVFAEGFGRSGRRGMSIDAHTPIVLGSTTKTLTAAAVVQQAEQGRLGLDAPVEALLPEFSLRPPFTPHSITARHLLTHRSGLSQWSGHDRRAQREGRVAHLRPRRAPDERSEYSSLNFLILGRMLERATDAAYGEALQATLLDPVRMTDAVVNDGGAWPDGVGYGHQSYFGVQLRRREPVPPRYLVPAGFVAASAYDLGRFGGALVGDGRVGDDRVLDAASVRAMLGPLDSTGRALGWGRARRDGLLILEHAGNGRTSSSRIRLVPERGYAVSVLTNTNTGPFVSSTADLVNGIQTILEGGAPPRVYPKERAVKLALLAATLFSVAQAGQRVRDWDRAGRPTTLDGSSRTLLPLFLDITTAALVVFGVPRYIGVPMRTLQEYFPDLALAMVVSATAGVAGGTARALTRSAR